MSELAPTAVPEPLVPPLALAAFIACVAGAAALADCAVLAALFRRVRTGLFSIIIQLATCDIILLGTTIGPELWSLNSKTWPFRSRACAAYQGLNVFTSTLSTYLVVAIALHSLTTIRLEEKSIKKRSKRKNYGDDEEIRSSQHSLVNSDSSTPPRTMNVDYRIVDIGLPVALPTISIWILAVSLSVPEFVLATTVHLGKNTSASMCILDFSHQFNMQSLLAVFNLLLPLFLMSTAAALIVVKLVNKSYNRASQTFDCKESMAALKLSLWLMGMHVIFCTPRTVVRAYVFYSLKGNESNLDITVQDNTVAILNLLLSSLYLIATLMRPVMCIIILPRLRKLFALNLKNTDEV